MRVASLKPFGSQRFKLKGLRKFVLSLIAAFTVCSRAYAFTITPIFDGSISNDVQHATIMGTIQAAIAVYEADLSDPVSVSIRFSKATNISLGENYRYGTQLSSYAEYLTTLTDHQTSYDDELAVYYSTYLNPYTPNNPLNNTNIVMAAPLFRALGLDAVVPPAGSGPVTVSILYTRDDAAKTSRKDREVLVQSELKKASQVIASLPSDQSLPDGDILLNTPITNLSASEVNPNKYSLFAVVSHEIDEVLGFGSLLFSQKTIGPIQPEDLFRYDTDLGVRSFSVSGYTNASFAIVPNMPLLSFDPCCDYSDWGFNAEPHVQDQGQTPGATPELDVELRVLDVIGYTRTPGSVWVDFNYTGSPQSGRYNNPFLTIHQGVAGVPGGGTILIKGNGSSAETMTISTAMTIVAVGGPVTIGR
jgi:hypothetical protein